MEFSAARLRIDTLCGDDAEALFRYRSDPVVARYQGWVPATKAEVLDFVHVQQQLPIDARGVWIQRAIRLHGQATLIGDIGVYVPNHPEDSYEFGITIALSHQGQRFAHEAVHALFAHLFDVVGVRRIHASIDPRNLASAALLRSLGMRQEAHFRESFPLRGEWVDDVIFAMLASEWPLAKARNA